MAEMVLVLEDAFGRQGENPPLQPEGLWVLYPVSSWGCLGGKMVLGQWLLGLSNPIYI